MHLNFSPEAPEQKLRIGRIVKKVFPVVQRILPIVSQFVPALVPAATIVGAIKLR